MKDYAFFMIVLYLTLVTVLIGIEYFTVGKWLRYNELARRAIGIGTVLGLLAPFVFMDVLEDAQTAYTVVCLGFLAAAAVKLLFEAIEHERNRQRDIELEEMMLDDEISL